MTYLFVKTLHVVSAAIWVGGLVALLAPGIWLARHARDALPPARCRPAAGSASVCLYQPAW